MERAYLVIEYIAIRSADHSSYDQVAQNLTSTAVKAFGRLDGVVICHGVLDPIRMGDETVENLKFVYDVNVFSCFAVVSTDTCTDFQTTS